MRRLHITSVLSVLGLLTPEQLDGFVAETPSDVGDLVRRVKGSRWEAERRAQQAQEDAAAARQIAARRSYYQGRPVIRVQMAEHPLQRPRTLLVLEQPWKDENVARVLPPKPLDEEQRSTRKLYNGLNRWARAQHRPTRTQRRQKRGWA